MIISKLNLKIIFCCSLFFITAFKHPFYLGVTDLKYNANQKSIQGSVKLFTNDFETTLKKMYKQPIDLINTKDTAAIKKIIADYISKHLLLKLNGNPKNFTIIGFEREEEAVFTYIEYKNCESVKTIEIEISLLYENFKEQMNIVHFELNGTKKSIKVNNPDKKIEFKFE